MKRSLRLLAVALAAGLALAASPLPSSASVTAAAKATNCDPWQGRNFYISVLKPDTPKMVIGINRASMNSGERAILATLDVNAPNQRWDYRPCLVGGSWYLQLQNRKSHLCLDKSEDVPNGNGNAVYQYRCSDPTGSPPADNQLWRQQSQGGSSGQWQQLYNRAGNRCLDITNEKFENGALLVQWDCAPNQTDTSSRTQQWNAYP